MLCTITKRYNSITTDRFIYAKCKLFFKHFFAKVMQLIQKTANSNSQINFYCFWCKELILIANKIGQCCIVLLIYRSSISYNWFINRTYFLCIARRWSAFRRSPCIWSIFPALDHWKIIKTELLHMWNNQSSSSCIEIKNFSSSLMILYTKSNKPNTYKPYLLIHLL